MVEKTIADFFINNQKKINFSAKSVATKLFVSEASLSRFAQKCGYRGYREFIYQYEESFVEKKEFMTGNTLMILNAYIKLIMPLLFLIVVLVEINVMLLLMY